MNLSADFASHYLRNKSLEYLMFLFHTAFTLVIKIVRAIGQENP